MGLTLSPQVLKTCFIFLQFSFTISVLLSTPNNSTNLNLSELNKDNKTLLAQ